MQKPVGNKLNTMIGHSGNSDVDLTVNVEIDTIAIAYGMLCSLYAKGELTDLELEKGIQKLHKLIERDKKRKKFNNNSYNQSTPKLFNSPEQNTRRNWLF
ncbi:hypothetical protein [Mesobacillus zeae]|uniref:Uncharacterized protein n=1 Tax=Mesobacillus zeae TaxID=1917180 RepID=A0A398AWV8_9BACI|nr:hypothetical protein [Mesobacillus zeae]RID82132.1 hypothetical protein D1970_19935 [Mesobacillus zeae]